jgi:hypothetical protein
LAGELERGADDALDAVGLEVERCPALGELVAEGGEPLAHLALLL